MENFMALLIPISGSIGLFVAISLGIYFRHKTKKAMFERLPVESIGEFMEAESKARTAKWRSAIIRLAGLLMGAGLGLIIGILFSGMTDGVFSPHKMLMVNAFAILFAGVGLMAAWFLERRLDKKQV